MSLALHAHHILIIATLAFSAAVLIPFWYTSPTQPIKRNVFDVCVLNTCSWILVAPVSSSQSLQTIVPLVAAYAAIACVGISLIGLIFGSWYVKQSAGDNGSKCLFFLTVLCAFISFLLSCGVWTIMLTINKHQDDTTIKDVRLDDFGFSFWINIGASGAYLYAFFIYLIASSKSC